MNKITTYSYCTCGNDEDCLLRLVAGNDFTMRLSLTKKIEGADVPYYLDDVEDMIVNVVTTDGSRTVLDSFIDGQSRVIVAVDANVLEMYVPYSIELVWRDEPYDRRAATPNLFMYVATQQEATEAQDEIVAGPYDYQMTIENDIVYVAVGAIPEMDPFDYVTYVQLDNALSSYATIEYVNDAVEHMVDLTDYYTKEQIDDTLSSYVTSDALSSMGYITINEVPEVDLSSYTTFDDISNMSYATTAYVTNAIDAIPEVDLSSYTTFDDISAMGYITINDVPEVDLSSYTTFDDISNMSYVTEQELEAKAYVTKTALEGNYYSKTDIDSTLSSYATKSYVAEAVSNVQVDLTGYVTQDELSAMGYITAADIPQVDLSSYTTFGDISAMGYITINDVPTPDLSSYVTEQELSSKGYITINDVPTPDLSNYVTYAYLEEALSDIDVDLSSYVTEQELSAMGYITINDVPQVDLSSYTTFDDISAMGYITINDVPTPDLSSYVTYSYLDEQFNDYITYSYLEEALSDIDVDVDLSYYVEITYFNNSMQGAAAALNDLNTRVNESYTSALAYTSYTAYNLSQEISSVRITANAAYYEASEISYSLSHDYYNKIDIDSQMQGVANAISYLNESMSYIDVDVDLSSYVTKTELSSMGYITAADIPQVDLSSYTTFDDISAMGYITINDVPTPDLSSYVTEQELSAMGYITINDVPTPDLSSYVSYSYWESSNEAVAYFITQQTLKNIDIQNNYYSKAQTDAILSSYASVQDITNALRNYVTTYENEQQNEVIAYAISYLEDAVSNIPMPDLSSYVSYAYLDNYYTSYDIDSQMRGVANAISYNDSRITDISSSYVSSSYIRNIVQMTSAEYSQITPDTNTLYIII